MVQGHDYAPTPGRYVGSEDVEDDGVSFEDRFPLLVRELDEQFDESERLAGVVREALAGVDDGF